MLSFIKPYKKKAILSMVFLLGVVIADLLIPRLTQRVIDEGINQQNMQVIIISSLMMFGCSFNETLKGEFLQTSERRSMRQKPQEQKRNYLIA